MKYTLPQNRWRGEQPVEIDVPDCWQTHFAGMAGDELPVLSVEELRQRINNPVGSPRISELAKGKESAIIIFDDMSRGTPIEDAAHIVLEELFAGGIEKQNIVFLCALGMHGGLERDDFAKKLGEDIVSEYFVFNHNPYEHFVDLGLTSRGHRIQVNAEVMNYDLKIGIGAIVPHPTAGFGGGCKIALPGVCSIDTVEQNHRAVRKSVWDQRKGPFYDNLGNLNVKDLREDAEEAAMMIGLDFKIDMMMNTSCQIVDVSCGQPIQEYYDGVKRAFDIYRMEHFDKVDVCIVNANSKPNEARMGYNIGCDCAKEGGDVVLINFSQTGIVNHFMSGYWGRDTSGRLAGASKHRNPLPPHVRQLIIYNPYKQLNALTEIGRAEQVHFATTWEEVMSFLGDRGEGTTAAVIKEGLMSIFVDDFKKTYVPVNINLTKK
jgi:nickel-dependent lactate racemase